MTEQADEEFREFMSGRWPAMVRLAYGLTGDQGHAEDLAQTAFAKAYASWSRVSRSGNPGSRRSGPAARSSSRSRSHRASTRCAGTRTTRPGEWSHRAEGLGK